MQNQQAKRLYLLKPSETQSIVLSRPWLGKAHGQLAPSRRLCKLFTWGPCKGGAEQRHRNCSGVSTGLLRPLETSTFRVRPSLLEGAPAVTTSSLGFCLIAPHAALVSSISLTTCDSAFMMWEAIPANTCKFQWTKTLWWTLIQPHLINHLITHCEHDIQAQVQHTFV
jgi:hypothetical protein